MAVLIVGDAKYKERHKELGLCVYCSEPAHYPRVRCKKHVLTSNKASRDFYKRHRKSRLQYFANMRKHRREKDLCIACGRPKGEQDKGMVKCINCRLHIHLPLGVNPLEVVCEADN